MANILTRLHGSQAFFGEIFKFRCTTVQRDLSLLLYSYVNLRTQAELIKKIRIEYLSGKLV